MKVIFVLVCIIFLTRVQPIFAQQSIKWGDQHDGTYANPVLPGDFQNTDVIRVDSIYYYISATKELSPGMMVLSSKDLVNWTIIGHAVTDLTRISLRYNYDKMEGTSRGIWAGAIRYHDNKFYIFFTDPDIGIFMTTAVNAAGPWKPLVQLMNAPGWDDPCPLWDDDGQAYFVATHFSDNYKIHLFKMSAGGEQLMMDSDRVLHQGPGSEASKLYKINNFYYHFYSEVTPEGRIPFMSRSTNIAGPYEARRQLIHKADREPNQGGLVQTMKGDWYFVTHHGKAGWEGREASLIPVTWTDGWPVWGRVGADGIGNMVWADRKPVEDHFAKIFQTSDGFDSSLLSPQWEWYFQPRKEKWSLNERPGFLRLYACKPLQPGVVTKTTNVLTQRPLRLEKSTATIKLDISHMENGQVAALCLFGKKTGAIGIKQAGNYRSFYFNDNGKITDGPEVNINSIWLQMGWNSAGLANFSYSTDGVYYNSLGNPFNITNFGNFLGAKIGIYTSNDTGDNGFVDIDWLNYEVN